MGDDGDLTWRTFRREIVWVLVLFPITWLVVWFVDARDGSSSSSFLEILGISVLLAVVLGPLIWVRWARHGSSTRRNLKAVGLATGWAVVSGVAAAAVWNLVD